MHQGKKCRNQGHRFWLEKNQGRRFMKVIKRNTIKTYIHGHIMSTRSCPAVQTSNVTQIRSQPGFLNSAHQFLFPQSPILSTFLSSPASFTPLLRNSLSHHCLRNQHWIKKNSRTIGQSRISHFQNNRTCRQIPSQGSPHFQQSTQFSSVSLLQTSLH